jgi:hypothetical protein
MYWVCLFSYFSYIPVECELIKLGKKTLEHMITEKSVNVWCDDMINSKQYVYEIN